jgi:DNA-binding transcriptional LysR family regulator
MPLNSTEEADDDRRRDRDRGRRKSKRPDAVEEADAQALALCRELDAAEPTAREVAVGRMIPIIEGECLGSPKGTQNCLDALRQMVKRDLTPTDVRSLAKLLAMKAKDRDPSTRAAVFKFQTAIARNLGGRAKWARQVTAELFGYLAELAVERKEYAAARDLAATLSKSLDDEVKSKLKGVCDVLKAMVKATGSKTPGKLLLQRLDDLMRVVQRQDDLISGRVRDLLDIRFEERLRYVALAEILTELGPTHSNKGTVVAMLAGHRWKGLDLEQSNLVDWVLGLNEKAHCSITGTRPKVPARRRRRTRDADWVKHRLVDVETTMALTPLGVRVWQLWHRCLQDEASEYQQITNEAGAKAVGGGKIVIAAGDTVRSYLLPYVITRFGRESPGTAVRLADYSLRSVYDDVEAGRVDLAIGWDLPPTPPKAKFEIQALVGSETTPHILLPPDHRLVAGPRDGTELPAVSAEDIPVETLLYPPIPALAAVATAVSGSVKSREIQMSLPSLGYHVMVTRAVGIIPGWSWLRRDLERRFHLQTARWQLADQQGVPEMGLRTLRLREGVRALANPPAGSELIGRFLSSVRLAIASLKSESWHSDYLRLTPGESSGSEFTGSWHYYYITRGQDPAAPIPYWCHSVLAWTGRIGPATLSGVMPLGPPFEKDKWPLDVRAEVIEWGDGFHVVALKTARRVTNEPASAFFARQASHPSLQGCRCLIGVNVCRSITGQITASPAILASEEIGHEYREEFIRQNVISLLAPDGAADAR